MTRFLITESYSISANGASYSATDDGEGDLDAPSSSAKRPLSINISINHDMTASGPSMPVILRPVEPCPFVFYCTNVARHLDWHDVGRRPSRSSLQSRRTWSVKTEPAHLLRVVMRWATDPCSWTRASAIDLSSFNGECALDRL